MSRFTFAVVPLVAAFLVAGCTDKSVPPIPDTPQGTIEVVAKTLADKQPGVIWSAMPASYQKDVSGLIETFAAKMDKEIYDKTFAVMGKAVQVLQDKKDFILGHPMLQQMQLKTDELKGNWDSVVGILNTVVGSEIKSLDSLKTLDVGDFLAGTGAKLMRQMSAASKAAPTDEMGQTLEKLRQIKVEVVSTEGDKAKLKITVPETPTEEVDLVKVEGKWVPKDLADNWARSMQDARKALDEMKVAESKGQAMMMLGGIEGALDGLLKAASQEEFNQLAGQAVGQIMGGVMGGMGAGGPGGRMEAFPPMDEELEDEDLGTAETEAPEEE